MSAAEGTAEMIFDEATRPSAPSHEDGFSPTPRGQAVAARFREVHEGYRTEMREVLTVLVAVVRGTEQVGAARGELHKLAIRAHDWRLGGYCQADLGPVLDRLDEEHHAIHDLLERVDAALIHLVQHPGEHERIDDLIRLLNQAILSHSPMKKSS